jgi:hypothetical protein
MQDKTIDSILRHLHLECMNGRHEGLMWVLALMRLRGVKPSFRMYAKKRGSRGQQRLAREAKARAAATREDTG